jgi:uncharacterized membrane protein
MRVRILAALVVPTALSAPAVASAAPARYIVVELGTLGGRSSYARGIDDTGRIVGWASDAHGRGRAFKLDRPRPIAAGDALPMPPADGLPGPPEHSSASGIANDGTIAGTTRDTSGGEWAWLWMPDGRMVKGATGTSSFLAMSATGDAAGYVYRWSGAAARMIKAPYVRKADGTTVILSTFEGDARAFAIAGPNLFVGESRISAGADTRAFVWRGAAADDPGLFGGPGPKSARAIASTGRWAGTSGTEYDGIAFTAAAAGVTPVELPRPAGATKSAVRDIDAFDRLVGWVKTGSTPRAAYWHVGPTSTEVVELKTRVPPEYRGYLMEAAAINAEGVILVDGVYGTPAENRALVLVPVKMTIALPERIQTGNGATAEFVVSGCEPGATVRIYKGASVPAAGRGSGYRAMGIRWDIDGPDTFGPDAVADAAGVARVRVNMTVEANKTLYLQAVHRGNKSTVVSITPTQAPLVVPSVKLPPGVAAPTGVPLAPVPAPAPTLNLKK